MNEEDRRYLADEKRIRDLEDATAGRGVRAMRGCGNHCTYAVRDRAPAAAPEQEVKPMADKERFVLDPEGPFKARAV